MLPAFQTASNHYKKEETVILSQIHKFKKAKLKATKKRKQFERGDRSQGSKKSRTAMKRDTEKLTKAKKKSAIIIKSKFQNSTVS